MPVVCDITGNGPIAETQETRVQESHPSVNEGVTFRVREEIVQNPAPGVPFTQFIVFEAIESAGAHAPDASAGAPRSGASTSSSPSREQSLASASSHATGHPHIYASVADVNTVRPMDRRSSDGMSGGYSEEVQEH